VVGPQRQKQEVGERTTGRFSFGPNVKENRVMTGKNGHRVTFGHATQTKAKGKKAGDKGGIALNE